MKTMVHFKRIKVVAAFLMAILFTMTVFAQGDVYESPVSNTINSIIRNDFDSNYVIYNTDGRDSYFSYHTLGSATMETFLHTTVRNVNDMEIYNNRVFFCGDDGANPVVGWFDVSGFWSSSINVDLIPLNMSFLGSCTITKLSKLDVIYYAPDECHVVMVGECSFALVGDPNVYYCIVDCYTPSITNGPWTVETTTIQKDYLQFDDIAVSDNFVAVTSRLRYDPNHPKYVYFFRKPTNGSSSIFAVNPTIPFCYNSYRTYEASAIEWIGGDMFQTVVYAYDGMNTGLILSDYDALTSSNISSDLYNAPSYIPIGEVSDMAYTNPPTLTYILQNTTTGPTLVYNNIYKSPLSASVTALHSVDKVNGLPNTVVASGTSNGGRLALYVCDNSSYLTPCEVSGMLGSTGVSTDDTREESFPTGREPATATSSLFAISTNPVYLICY